MTILSTLILSACGAPQSQKSEPLPKLTIGLMPDVDSLPFIIAQEEGYFKEEGLDIELQQFKSAMDRDAALQSGTLDGEEVTLTPTEYDILRLLLENPGKVFSSADIYRRVWKDEPFSAEGTVPVHIRHLREKLEIDPTNPRYLKVVWGKGYKLEEMKK